MQPNLIMESEIHSSLHSNCHHQKVFTKFNLSVFYPLPYPLEELFGIMKEQILNLSEGLLISLTG